MRLIFDKFDELGSGWAVYRYLVRHGLRLSTRLTRGPHRGEVVQRLLPVGRIYAVLRHPLYAGAYVYGRRPTDPRRPAHGRCRARQRWVPMAEWRVLLRDRLPAYITWEHYLENQERLRGNRQAPSSPGVPRRGGALLGGLLRCGTCGRRLQVHYRAAGQPYYSCHASGNRGRGRPVPGCKRPRWTSWWPRRSYGRWRRRPWN